MTDEPEDGTYRRRRRRATAEQGAPVPGPPAPPPAAPTTAPAPPVSERPRGQRQSARDAGERGLRDIVGAGRSQLGVSGALRGRDVDRPTEDDLAEAEESVVIVRRNWAPPAGDRKTP